MVITRVLRDQWAPMALKAINPFTAMDLREESFEKSQRKQHTLGTTCVSPIYYEVAPTNGEACKKGWMNIGAGYCKKKEPLGIL